MTQEIEKQKKERDDALANNRELREAFSELLEWVKHLKGLRLSVVPQKLDPPLKWGVLNQSIAGSLDRLAVEARAEGVMWARNYLNEWGMYDEDETYEKAMSIEIARLRAEAEGDKK